MHSAAGGTIQRLNPGLAIVWFRSRIDKRPIPLPRSRRRGLPQIDGLIMASLVQLRAPHLMRTLVLVRTESYRRTQSQVEIMHSLEFVDEFFCVYVTADPLDGLGENVGVYVTLERNVIGWFTGKILGESFLVFQNDRGVAVNRRHHLGDYHASGISRPQQHQLVGQRGAANE